VVRQSKENKKKDDDDDDVPFEEEQLNDYEESYDNQNGGRTGGAEANKEKSPGSKDKKSPQKPVGSGKGGYKIPESEDEEEYIVGQVQEMQKK
jgi:hypothetical protein